MTRLVLTGSSAIDKIISGATTLNLAVSATLGPNGKYALFANNYGEPQITKDGVAVSNEVIQLSCPAESLAVKAIQQAASKSGLEAGDGTTTTTILATNLIVNGLSAVLDGKSAVELIRGYTEVKEQALANLESLSKPCNTIEQIQGVATISANNDEFLGGLIAEAIDKVGNDGVITVENSDNRHTYLEVKEGYIVPKGYASDYFCNDANKVVLDNPLILLSNNNIETALELIPILQETTKAGKPLLIICPKIAPEALQNIISNHVKGTIRVALITLPGTSESRLEDLQDIAAATNAKVICEEALSNAKINDLGSAKKVIITRDNCTILQGDPKALENKLFSLKAALEDAKSPYEKEKLQERIAKLVGGICILKVGAETEIELIEKKARIEDAILATKAAIDSGIVPGGGVALLSCIKTIPYSLDDSNDSYNIGKYLAIESLKEPLKMILGSKKDEYLEVLVDSNNWYCYNANTDKIENAEETYIVDPTLVTKQAILNSFSVAETLINTDVIIVEDK